MSALERDLRGLYVRLVSRGALQIAATLVLGAVHVLVPSPPHRILGSPESRIDAVEAYLQKLSTPPRLSKLAMEYPDPYADGLLRELYGKGFFELLALDSVREHAQAAYFHLLPTLQRAVGIRPPLEKEALAAIEAPQVFVAYGDMRRVAWSSSTHSFVGTTVTGDSAVIKLPQAAAYTADAELAIADIETRMQYNQAGMQAYVQLEELFEHVTKGPWAAHLDARRGVMAITHPEHDTAWCTPNRLLADLGKPDWPSLNLPRPRRRYASVHPVTNWIDQTCRRLTSGELWFLRYESRAGQWSLARTGDPGVWPFY